MVTEKEITHTYKLVELDMKSKKMFGADVNMDKILYISKFAESNKPTPIVNHEDSAESLHIEDLLLGGYEFHQQLPQQKIKRAKNTKNMAKSTLKNNNADLPLEKSRSPGVKQ